MSDLGTRLDNLRMEHERLLRDCTSLYEEIKSQDLLRDNETLRNELAESRQELESHREKLRALHEENVRLRTALHEQIMDEKLSMVALTRRKLETYFASETAGMTDRLTAFTRQAQKQIADLAERANRHLGAERQAFLEAVHALSAQLSDRIRALERLQWEERQRVTADLGEGLGAFEAEGVDETVIEKRVRQNRLEMKIGLNWINRLGILLILFGVGAAFRYSYTWFNDHMKAFAFLLLGLLMLGGGEWFSRRKQRVFALGLIGGGIAVLYADIFYSHFSLAIIGLTVGLFFSVLVTALAAFLASWYKSRTICMFALVGGYLPLYTYWSAAGLEGHAVYAAMGYLFLLNAFLLALSFRQRWPIVHFTGFFLNMFSSMLLSFEADSTFIGLLNIFVTFALYQAIVLGYPLVHRMKIGVRDLILLGINTFVSASLLYLLLEVAEWDDFSGLLSVLFALCFAGLARLVEQQLPQERQTKVLFYATSLAFAVLAVPFQFGARWLSLGWLVEGIVLILIGMRYRFKWMERTGWGLLLFCLTLFLWWDVLISGALMAGDASMFNLKYTFVSLGTMAVAYAAAQRRVRDGWPVDRPPGEDTFQRVIGYVGLVNLWFWLLYELRQGFTYWQEAGFPHPAFYQGLASALATLGLAYAAGRVRLLQDQVVAALQYVFYVFGCLIGLVITLSMPALKETMAQNTAAEWIALLLLVGYNVLAFLAGREIVLALVRLGNRSTEWVPLTMGVYLIAVMSGFMIVQFRLGNANLVLSLMYLLLSIAFVIYGFRHRYVYIRRLGLGLSLAATAKLFLFDLVFLAPTGKIAAYFCFGLALLGISYLYQRLSVRLGEREPNGNGPAEEAAGKEPAERREEDDGIIRD